MVKKMDRASVDRAAALLSYPIAYIYLYWFMTNDYTYRPRLFTQWGGHFLFSGAGTSCSRSCSSWRWKGIRRHAGEILPLPKESSPHFSARAAALRHCCFCNRWRCFFTVRTRMTSLSPRSSSGTSHVSIMSVRERGY